MTDPKCSNCGYEVDEVTEVEGLCQTCNNAYVEGINVGYQIAKKGENYNG